MNICGRENRRSASVPRRGGVAIGLQAVDGLTPSSYLVETAKCHIEGDISIDVVRDLIATYCRTRFARSASSAISLPESRTI